MTLDDLELGYDIPARPGMMEAEILTPALVLDLDVLERNLATMAAEAKAHGMRLRPHGKMHKSVDVARLQMARGAVGLCAQKVSEAEAFARGGIPDILVSNQVTDPAKLDRLAGLAAKGTRISVCVDDMQNVSAISAAATTHGIELHCLVEIDSGAGRCGVTEPQEAVALARVIEGAQGLRLEGLQSYQGAAQHIADPAQQAETLARAEDLTARTVAALADAGLPPEVVTGGGTGSYRTESASPLFTELQCGSYAFMDADYGRIEDHKGQRLDQRFGYALFVLASVISVAKPGQAVCDAGLKSLAVDSGLPRCADDDLSYLGASDEHGQIADPANRLRLNDRLRLIPGHCDPNVNLHDWFVGLRGGVVECLWPVSARGKSL
ncbi:Low-specificity L-threonine aldolase [Candidatus Rhodobacter oscarellae]|uniref:Low-specificity L-threonine aldolase n=1 Tax=Candidatus Rhodobacter oscarellae TaxID=1675527 RepID=A0A0J9EAQ4_9RHOB|nr:Low-specificity L-threonine aldolase [Candidatus Rhodobacter lobularis]